MRQLTCSAPNSIAWRDVPEPRLQGDGEALVRPLTVARCDIDLFLTSGLFPSRVPSPSTYHLVCRPEGLEDPRIVALRDWLVDALAS